jgi:methylated-DNA-[protein]-cysteine S-methyltransferase
MDKLPPIEKIHEAYSAIADGRVTIISETRAVVCSSNRKKEYTVAWEGNTYFSNDSASYWQGYAGYPVIGVLMLQGRLTLSRGIAALFAGVDWTALNAKHKRDYAKASEKVLAEIEKGGGDRVKITAEIENVYEEIKKLDITVRRGPLHPPKLQLEGTKMKNIWYYDFSIGILGISEDGDGITDIFFKNEKIMENVTQKETTLLQEAAKQLREYFDGRRKSFELPLSLHGTEFQFAVWRALQTIPYGETRSYKQIAEQIGNPKASRAVGMANNRNPVMIVVPCHRVVGQDGSMIGYAGGLDAKKFLLDLENRAPDHPF